MKNTVIFDLDGLLMNREMITYQLYCDLTAKYNQHMSLEEYVHDYCGKTAVSNMQALIDAYKLPVSVETGLAFMSLKEQKYFRNTVLLKRGAKELDMKVPGESFRQMETAELNSLEEVIFWLEGQTVQNVRAD